MLGARALVHLFLFVLGEGGEGAFLPLYMCSRGGMLTGMPLGTRSIRDHAVYLTNSLDVTFPFICLCCRLHAEVLCAY